MNLYSNDDNIAGPSYLAGATNVELPGLDHLQVITSSATFDELYRFFNDGDAPATADIIADEPIVISGRVVIFAENTPVPFREVRIFEVDTETGERVSDIPDGIFLSDAQGYWGDFTARPGAAYEFLLEDPDGFWPPLHYYREPFPRSDNKVYFRVFPDPFSLLGFVFRVLPLRRRPRVVRVVEFESGGDRGARFPDGERFGGRRRDPGARGTHGHRAVLFRRQLQRRFRRAGRGRVFRFLPVYRPVRSDCSVERRAR
ncbi:MAG: hypothetical protein M5R36_18650 [Deltaproteobacteria bacterium]|nr:hypothetical protein [Deltaproteobacteria bacterium]